ncbi:hypothetical protein CEP54_014830 [Fusarium duplospermum]|uniref:Uncharacterized protein n=1 Tax=Fusarium duplospermum TaxID=1325734 RepID=A0A428NTJ8_9HYPO|nr:hypothetical protein CEP54_014830 [Fusarium duplospermum]
MSISKPICCAYVGYQGPRSNGSQSSGAAVPLFSVIAPYINKQAITLVFSLVRVDSTGATHRLYIITLAQHGKATTLICK